MLYPRMKAVIEKRNRCAGSRICTGTGFLAGGSRHLGLVLPGEIENLQEQMRQLGDCLEKTLDVDVLLKLGEKRRYRCARVCDCDSRWFQPEV